MRIRLLLHALDRTGPPMLAMSFARWLARTHPEHDLEWVSFRGGALLDAALELGPTSVLLDPHAPWNHDQPEPWCESAVRDRASRVGHADVQLAVSVSAGQVVPYLPEPSPPLVTWSVEQGEDLHWVSGPLDLPTRTASWLAGSSGTNSELRELLGSTTHVRLMPEFVEDVTEVDPTDRERRRHTMGSPQHPGLLVVGAGIATHRKAPDLFVELALTSVRRHGPVDRFVWLGGEDDELFPTLLGEVHRLDLTNVRFLGNVVDVVPWLAAADVLAHPARLDAFPLVALHAALAETPVVGFGDRGGLGEMFGDDLLGAPFPDLERLLDLIDTLRDDEPRRAAGAKCRAAVVDRFTTHSAGERLLAHLARVADQPTTEAAP